MVAALLGVVHRPRAALCLIPCLDATSQAPLLTSNPLARTPPCMIRTVTDGKIHYMEDTHKANHHAQEEERICMDLVRQQRVSFLA